MRRSLTYCHIPCCRRKWPTLAPDPRSTDWRCRRECSRLYWMVCLPVWSLHKCHTQLWGQEYSPNTSRWRQLPVFEVCSGIKWRKKKSTLPLHKNVTSNFKLWVVVCIHGEHTQNSKRGGTEGTIESILPLYGKKNHNDISQIALKIEGAAENMSDYLGNTNWHVKEMGKHEANKLTYSPLCDFIAQLVRALHRHRRGHGFESRWVTWIFQVHETIA